MASPRTSPPDLVEYMNAYAVLEVEYTATVSEIRRAYRRLAQFAHPDRQPHNSSDQQRATARMAAINAAYDLVRDAPLRHHRVSRCSDDNVHWSDQDLQNAVRRARSERITWEWVSVALCGIVGVFASWGLVSRLGYLGLPGFGLYVFVMPLLCGLAAAFLGRRFFSLYYLADALLMLARIGFR